MTVDFALNMPTEHKVLYEFGPFRADPEKQILSRDHQQVPITPKVFETLLILVRRSGEVVTKDDLMKELWPDAFVEESNLSQNIFMLRKALGDAPEDRRYIVTVPGRGYRFATDVRTVRLEGEHLMIASHTRSHIVVEQTNSDAAQKVIALPAPRASKVSRTHAIAIAVVIAIGLLVLGASFLSRWRRPVALRETDPLLIADFTNTTGDAVFDDTLRQGLVAQLEQSPFVSLMPEDRVRHTLELMGQRSDVKLSPELGREVCARAGGGAVLDGSIAKLGSEYVVGLRATDCRDGAILDEEQAQAARKEDVLDALTQIASRFRTRVGESLSTIKEHDTALAEATTPSLEALKAYSTGRKLITSKADAALPFFQRAIALDPNFAMAYAFIGRIYGDLGEAALSAENTRKAYELRDHTSDPEKFWIMAAYDMQVTENLERAEQTCKVWEQTYPRDPMPKSFLAGVIYPIFGRYEEAIDRARKARALDPDFSITYYILAMRYQELGLFDEAEGILRTAGERKLDIPDFSLERFDLAFLRGNTAEMNRIAQSAHADALADEWITQHNASVLASAGRVQDAGREVQRAEELAREGGHVEAAALYEAGAALWEGFFGNAIEARREATEALKLSNNRGVEYGAGLALALSGDSSRAQELADDLNRRFPEDTGVQFNYLPTLRAQLALNRGEPAKAVELLEKAAPYEVGRSRVAIHANFGPLYPVYVRGESYVALHKGSEAVAEFHKVLDHRGVVVSDPVGVLARLQLGRAYAMSGDKDRTRSAYREFLTLWKDADADLPVLKQAKGEYAKVAEDQ
jgi:DNA-binding winged helix-turn-helix (wHTH) protein/tetratricopeptide (TPR) repeat protein